MRRIAILAVSFSIFFITGSRALAQAQDVTSSVNQFAFDLTKTIASQRTDNFVISPLSVYTALAMVSAGAAGETESQFLKTLRLTKDGSHHAALAKVLTSLKGDKSYSLFMANRIWGSASVDFEPEFLKTLATQYRADLEKADFSKRSPQIIKAINGWVEKQTKGKIKNLLQPNNIDSFTMAVLVNAIYFKGLWEKKFSPSATTDGNFWIDSTHSVEAKFMEQQAKFRTAELPEGQMISLPYVGGDLEFLAVLPPKEMDLSTFEKQFDYSRFQKMYAAMVEQTVQLKLPKFKMDTRDELVSRLMGLGLTDAFLPKSANFSRLVTSKFNDPDRKFFISAIIHQAVIEVNEEGTEAAAATAVVARSGAGPSLSKFTANRQFYYFVRHSKSGAILFVGRVLRP